MSTLAGHYPLVELDDKGFVVSEADEFADQVRPHLDTMRRLAARMGPKDAHDDIVQESLLRAWRYRKGFDPRRGSRATWLLTIVANEARRKSRRWRLPIEIRGSRERSEDDRLDLEDGVRRLSKRQRLAVDCVYYVGLSVAETASVMGCSIGTVKSHLSDARHQLKSYLETDP